MVNNVAKTELLAPVGSIEAFYAALSHGADALYFAGKKFGARAHLENFSEDEIIDMIEEAHRHHVKVYMTVNIIIKDEEFLEATQWVDFLVTHGADAIIVQDWGILHYIRHTYPSFPIHASTQMNTHDVTQAHKLYELGVQRIIFARETSLDVIREVIRTIPIETEVFVHGALCICHSGNCYLSSLIGKRSGNRGRCAQPCRLPYELEGVTEEAYLLSPKDLMTLDDLQLLVDANITSLKIEGRMKRPEYVGVTTQAYRRALDNLPNADAEKQMKATFNREFTKGFIFNESNSDLTNINSPNHIGIPVGKVIGYANGWIEVALNDSITVNDGLRIVGQEQDAIIVNEIMVQNQQLTMATAPMVVGLRSHKPITSSAMVLKTSDAALKQLVQEKKQSKIPLQGIVTLDNKHLILTVTDGIHTIQECSHETVSLSTNSKFNDRIREQLQKTGNDEYFFTSIEFQVDSVFLPISQINELRRQALYAIDEARIRYISPKKESWIPVKICPPSTHHLYFKVRTLKQLETCLSMGVSHVIVEKQEWCQYQTEKTAINYISPRITPLQNQKTLRVDTELISSVYENVANAHSLYSFHEKGKAVVGLSIELSLSEIEQLCTTYQKTYGCEANTMVMIYGHYELMITKHCLINKALGLDNKYCGKCHVQQYYLKDRMGFRFPLMDDGDCNLVLLNSKRLHLMAYMQSLQEAGVHNFLVDFTIEEDIGPIIQAYNDTHQGNYQYLELTDATYGYIKEGVM